jgi:erythronate-4-phosphate dehydrogenase
MKIAVDSNNPYAAEAFATLGEVIAVPAEKITRELLRDCQVLACRSTIRVDTNLLEGTAVRYVGTATIGIDHFDTAYLERAGIRYCNAPGCNADSVANYWTAAILWVARAQGTTLEGKMVGIVGCGNVGSRVARRAEALGMRVLRNDPPLARQTGDSRYVPLDALFEADYITLHTPLTREGRDATYHLVSEAFLRRMRPDAVLVNLARGAVADGAALKTALREKRIAGAILDVWEGEPSPDPELADLTFLATPHIAGHSFDGKINGTMQVYREVCAWLGKEPAFDPTPLLPPPDVPEIEVDATGRNDEDVLRDVVFRVYPIHEDDARFREAMAQPDASARARSFSDLRKHYPRRREFAWTRVRAHNASESLLRKLRGIGFATSPYRT